jgi:hypothetical protein
MTQRIVKISICALLHLEYTRPEDIESVTGLIHIFHTCTELRDDAEGETMTSSDGMCE